MMMIDGGDDDEDKMVLGDVGIARDVTETEAMSVFCSPVWLWLRQTVLIWEMLAAIEN